MVDDAIVMLENIVRHIEHGEKPYEAAMKGSAEIGFTILSMTISLAAVFIPIVFMGGIVGRLLHEFAVTIILAILFSGIISMTLTPMLCARILKDEHGVKHNAFYRWSENSFNRLQDAYNRIAGLEPQSPPRHPGTVRAVDPGLAAACSPSCSRTSCRPTMAAG